MMMSQAPPQQQQQQQQQRVVPPTNPSFKISQTLADNTEISRLLPRTNSVPSNNNNSNNNNRQYPPQQPSTVVIDDQLTNRFPNHSVVGVRDSRYINNYYYAVVFNLSTDLTPCQSKRRTVSSCLRQLKYLSNSRMCFAWHSQAASNSSSSYYHSSSSSNATGDSNTNTNNSSSNKTASVQQQLTSVPEEVFTMLNEECLIEQVPLMWAASPREVISLILSLARPTGIRSQRISAFGRSAQTVNAKMAALLLHTMPTQLLSETEAVRAVDMFVLLRSGSSSPATPAQMILFLAGADPANGTREDVMNFLTNKVLLARPRAERVMAVFKSEFVPGAGGNNGSNNNTSIPTSTNNNNIRQREGNHDNDCNIDLMLTKKKTTVEAQKTNEASNNNNAMMMMMNSNANSTNVTANHHHHQQQQPTASEDDVNAILVKRMMEATRRHVEQNTKSDADTLSAQVQEALKNQDGDDDDHQREKNEKKGGGGNGSDDDDDDGGFTLNFS